MNGFINLLKTPGITSSTAVSIVKKIYGLKKVGHAGTLDPGAAGVLPIMIGKATRLFDYLQDESKEYIAEFVFSVSTDTLDMQGKITGENVREVLLQELKGIIPIFSGKIMQRPPKVSAVSIDGKKAYALKRKEIDFEIPEKEITIHQIDIIRQTAPNSFLLKISCAKGTYIRSLCRDMAECLGTFGYVNYLVRTKSSGFDISQSISIESLRETPLEKVLVPIDAPIRHLQRTDIEKKLLGRMMNGVSVEHKGGLEAVFRVYCNDKFIGLGRPEHHNDIQYIKVFKKLMDEEEL